MRTSPSELAGLPDDFWDQARLVIPPGKRGIYIRVDEDVLAWFRSLGARYQTRMNAVLRSYMERTTVETHPERSKRQRKAKKARK